MRPALALGALSASVTDVLSPMANGRLRWRCIRCVRSSMAHSHRPMPRAGPWAGDDAGSTRGQPAICWRWVREGRPTWCAAVRATASALAPHLVAADKGAAAAGGRALLFRVHVGPSTSARQGRLKEHAFIRVTLHSGAPRLPSHGHRRGSVAGLARRRRRLRAAACRFRLTVLQLTLLQTCANKCAQLVTC